MGDALSTTDADAWLAGVGSTAYVELHTADPGAAGTTAVSVGNNTRQSVTFGAASGGSIAITNTPSWTNGGATETITDLAFWSQATGGTFLRSAQLASSEPWASGNILQLTSFSITLPIAS